MGIRRLIVVLAIAFLAAPTGASGDVREFIPRIYNNEGDLEIAAIYDDYKSTSAGKGSEYTDSFIAERFTLTTTGYVYHPRFIQFLGKLSLGFNQEKYTQTPASSLDQPWTNVTRGEYELRALVLPEHPYNLEAYTLRKEPLVRGLSAGLFRSTITSSGAMFKYKERPYNLLLSYDHSTIDSRTFTTGTDTFVASGAYTRDWGSFWGSYNHTENDTTQTQGPPNPSSNKGDTYSLGNFLAFWEKKVRLTSTVMENRFEQTSPQSTVHDDRLTWQEQMNIDLPWRFEAGLSYRYDDDDQTTRYTDRPSETNLWSRNQNANVVITQRVYQSMVNSYSHNYWKNTSSNGESTSSTNILSSTYRKSIPRGYFNAGISLGRSVTEVSGGATVINETHNAPIFVEFTLQGTNIEQTSIYITVKSVQTGNYLVLAKDTDYSVTRDGLTFRIRILSVPLEALNPDPFYVYEFPVTYSLVATDYKLETTNYGFSVKLNLFERLVNPYYIYYHSDQKVLSGFYPARAQTVNANTVGVSTERPSYTLLAEYQKYDSTLNPTNTFRAEGSYWKTFDETTSITANAYYTDTTYLAVPELDTPEYTQTTIGGRVRGEMKFPRQNLIASLAVNYWQTKGFFTTQSSLVSALLTWKTGQLDLNLGADVGSTVTDLQYGKQETNHYVYYLTMKRRLFGR